ncbi:uncharacterized protein APUU_11186S [Aspergillus puulaauensis]|uniref:Uncharacterized protein n=1 Tax=Aspergillus puulaauensis TaxID=1220207 RepID=A0A7R7XBU2_9EURO|nr:uncharacterized protein APUU_11186S [Aspergillus puulaauensis]BCS18358.1 hypothetical protein APUU_11186S [Aspergillus puulaauensis]
MENEGDDCPQCWANHDEWIIRYTNAHTRVSLMIQTGQRKIPHSARPKRREKSPHQFGRSIKSQRGETSKIRLKRAEAICPGHPQSFHDKAVFVLAALSVDHAPAF